MLEWMQRRKKYLLVTIWISVIALVSAGMLGWSPDFVVSSDRVAKVGNITITAQEYAQSYRSVLDEYSKVLKSNIDDEEAKRFGLDKEALSRVVQRAQILSFADEIGLRASKQEILNQIANNHSFQENGAFSPELYKRLLSENRIQPSQYEESIGTNILLNKVINLIPTNQTKLESKTLSNILHLKDQIFYRIFPYENLKKPLKESEISEYYKKNQDNYMAPKEVLLESRAFKLADQKVEQKDIEQFYNENKSLYIQDGKVQPLPEVSESIKKELASKLAQKAAYDAKDDFIKNGSKDTMSVTLDRIDSDLKIQLDKANIGDFLGPVLSNDVYILGKVIKITPPRTIPLKNARALVLRDLSIEKIKSNAMSKAQEFLKSTGLSKEVKKVEIDGFSTQAFDGLNHTETNNVVKQILGSQSKNGVIEVPPNRVIAYKIVAQTLPQANDVTGEIEEFSRNIKTQFVNRAFLTYLNSKYPPKVYESNMQQAILGGSGGGHH